MSQKNTVKIKVRFPAWSESSTSWFLLTEESENKVGWSCGKWFPKKECKYEEVANTQTAVLTLPLWLYNRLFNDDSKILK